MRHLILVFVLATASTCFAQVQPLAPVAPMPVGLPATCANPVLHAQCQPPLITRANPIPPGYSTISVCASGCTFSNSQLQTALFALSCGEVLTLDSTFAYVNSTSTPLQLPGTTPSGASTGHAALNCGPTNWAIIETNNPAAMPPDGVRITPAYSSALPTIETALSSLNYGLYIPDDTHYLYIWGLHTIVSPSLATAPCNGSFGECGLQAISIGSDAAGNNPGTTVADLPDHVVIDQVLLEGSESPQMSTTRGVEMACAFCAVTNSWIWKYLQPSKDTQAIHVGNATGPFLIDNNYLRGAGETIIIGGINLSIGAPFQPNNGTITRNQFNLPLTYRAGVGNAVTGAFRTSNIATYNLATNGVTPHPGDVAFIIAGTMSDPTFDENSGCTILSSPAPTVTSWSCNNSGPDASGVTANTNKWYDEDPSYAFAPPNPPVTGSQGQPDVKNLLEWKFGSDWLVQANWLCCIWPPGQSGRAIAINPTGTSTSTSWSDITNLTIAYNLLPGWTAGFTEPADQNSITPTFGLHTVHIHDNLRYGGNGDAGWNDLFTGSPGNCPGNCDYSPNPESDIWFDHNTDIIGSNQVIPPSDTIEVNAQVFVGQTPMPNFAFNANITAYDSRNQVFESCKIGTNAVPCTTANSYFKNIFYDTAGGNCSGNNWHTNAAACPVASQAAMNFANLALNDYRLTPSSPGFQSALDGNDVGANVVELDRETSAVLTGNWPTPRTVSHGKVKAASVR